MPPLTHTQRVGTLTLNVSRSSRSPLDSHLGLVEFCLSLDLVLFIFGNQIDNQNANCNDNTTTLLTFTQCWFALLSVAAAEDSGAKASLVDMIACHILNLCIQNIHITQSLL